jgi:hypothetical protein
VVHPIAADPTSLGSSITWIVFNTAERPSRPGCPSDSDLRSAENATGRCESALHRLVDGGLALDDFTQWSARHD